MKTVSQVLRKSKVLIIVAIATIFALIVVGCGSSKTGSTSNTSETAAGEKLAGDIKIDGSSTVGPISEAVAEEFMAQNPDVKVTVGISGTGGGFKKFVAGELDITDASREIKDEEKAEAEKAGIEYIEIPVAYDGISVVVNKDNDWAKDITVDELKKIWEPNSKVTTWKQVRAEWPDEKITLYGPGTDSGTFDYFTKEINGEEKASRTDYQPSEDDNVLVQGVAGDKGALGYFGYAYYIENSDKIKALAVNDIEPTEETIKGQTYTPLSRPLFLYVSKNALERPEVKAFLEFYLSDGAQLVTDVGYVQLDQTEYDKGLASIK